MNGVARLGDRAGQGRKSSRRRHDRKMILNKHIKHVPSNESKSIPAAVMTYLMSVLGDQTLFGDGGGRGRRGEGVGGDLLRN